MVSCAIEPLSTLTRTMIQDKMACVAHDLAWNACSRASIPLTFGR